MLRHDQALNGTADCKRAVTPAGAAPPAEPSPNRRSRHPLAVGAATAALLRPGARNARRARADPRRATEQRGPVIDPAANALTAAVRVGVDPVALGIGAGGIWVASAADRTAARVDARRRVVARNLGTGLISTSRYDTGVSGMALDRVITPRDMAG